MVNNALKAKYKRLQEIISAMDSLLLAYSGGVDSTLLLKAASVTSARLIAVTASSPTYTEREVQFAAEIAKNLGVKHMILHTTELEKDSFRLNPPDRCFHCKTELYTNLKEIAQEHALKHIIDGTNADDPGDYRPGIAAAQKCGVRSPLREAGLKKQEIRNLAKHLSLPNWDKPAMACLASRIPYGQAITREKLRQVEAAEEYLSRLGLKEVRVRHYGSTAKLEIKPESFSQIIQTSVRMSLVTNLKSLGFTYITLDLEGFRSGSMNAVLSEQGR